MANERIIRDIAVLTISIASAVEIVGKSTPGNPVAARLDKQIPLGYAEIARLQRAYDRGAHNYLYEVSNKIMYLVDNQICAPDLSHLI
jgi:hypothetical protein